MVAPPLQKPRGQFDSLRWCFSEGQMFYNSQPLSNGTQIPLPPCSNHLWATILFGRLCNTGEVSGHEEITPLQRQERWLCFAGPAVRSYPTSMVRDSRCWSSCEEIPHTQGQRRSLSKMVGGVNSCLKSNPIPARDAKRAQTNLVHTRTQRPPQRLRQNCV